MSYMAIIHVGPTGDARIVQRISNSWGFAPQIWRALHSKYIGRGYYMDDADALWALADDPRLSDAELTALLLTFDNVLVRKDDLLAVARDLNIIDKAWSIDFLGQAWHATAVAKALREAADDPDIQAVGFNCTSVAETHLMGVREGDGDGDYRPYNVNTDRNHWYLALRRSYQTWWRRPPGAVVAP